jgi:hypothetical protein
MLRNILAHVYWLVGRLQRLLSGLLALKCRLPLGMRLEQSVVV